MRPPEGVANTLAASEIQDVEAQMPEPVVGLKQGSIGVGSRVELVRGGGGGEGKKVETRGTGETGSLYHQVLFPSHSDKISLRQIVACPDLYLPPTKNGLVIKTNYLMAPCAVRGRRD